MTGHHDKPKFSRLAIGVGVLTAPMWLAQGAYVRRTTPRLPEPAGDRAGAAGPGPGQGAPTLRLLIAGDSAAAGVGAGLQQQALSGQLVQALANSINIHWRLIAQTGFDSRQLLDCLAQVDECEFDVAVVSIGVNDVTGGRRTGDWRASLDALSNVLERRFGVRHIVYSPLPPMHLFSALPQPLRWLMGQRALHFNRVLASYAVQDPRCVPMDLDYPTEAAYLASDGFHPGEPAYAFWASRIANAIFAATGLIIRSQAGVPDAR